MAKTFQTLLTESKIPKQTIAAFKKIADDKNHVSINDVFHAFRARGSATHKPIIDFLMSGDELGTKFFSVHGGGFDIKDMEEFDTDNMDQYIEVDDYVIGPKIVNTLVYKFENFQFSEMLYQLYKLFLQNNEQFDFQKIKSFLKKNPKLEALFNTTVGKEVLQKIYNKEFKSIADVIDFLKYHDESTHREHKISLKELGTAIKKYNSQDQVCFKNSKHYVCSVYLEDDSDLFASVQQNNRLVVIDKGRMATAEIYKYYKDSVTSHTITAHQGFFTIGWVRFSIVDFNGEKRCVIDEVQSDLKPDDDMTDKHKVYLPHETFEEFFGTVKNLYNMVVSKFLYDARSTLNYSEVYSPSYDYRAQLNKMEKEPDREKYRFLDEEEFEMIKKMTPPMFPYKEILPSFGFKKSEKMPGFLVLEKTKQNKRIL